MDLISSRATEVMAKALDGLMVRHQAISSNLANVDTPGYKAMRVDFEDKLQQVLEKEDGQKAEVAGMKPNSLQLNQGLLELNATHSKHFGATHIKLGELNINAYQDNNISFRNDDNAVDIDTEMSELAKNSMKYEALAHLEGKSFMLTKEIIRSSGG